jgi:hypothetical protein
MFNPIEDLTIQIIDYKKYKELEEFGFGNSISEEIMFPNAIKTNIVLGREAFLEEINLGEERLTIKSTRTLNFMGK